MFSKNNGGLFENIAFYFHQPAARRTATVALAGFTIVELLIVIVVIGILAVIVIVAYNGIQNRAYDTAVQNDLTEIAKKIEIYSSNNNGIYPTTSQLAAVDIEVTKTAYDTSENNLYYCLNPTTNEYAMAARSKSKKDYKMIGTVVSTSPSKVYGADTCNLISAPNAAVQAWNAATQAWQSWVH